MRKVLDSQKYLIQNIMRKYSRTSLNEKCYDVSYDNQKNCLYLNPILVPHKRTMIWLHGLGDSGYGFLDVFMSKYNPVSQDTKVVLPTAPEQPVSVNNGAKSTSWYDIKSLEGSADNDDLYNLKDVSKSEKLIHSFMKKELEIIKDPKYLFLGGFSQGCALSLHTALQYEKQIGGIFGFSGLLFNFTQIKNKNLPIRLSHGGYDPMINVNIAKISYKKLETECKDFKFYIEQNLDHSINLNQLETMSNQYMSVISNQK